MNELDTLIRQLSEVDCDAQWTGENGLFERAARKIKQLRDTLIDVAELIDGYVDIVDGPEGNQLPNDAMRAVQLIDEALGNGRY